MLVVIGWREGQGSWEIRRTVAANGVWRRVVEVRMDACVIVVVFGDATSIGAEIGIGCLRSGVLLWVEGEWCNRT